MDSGKVKRVARSLSIWLRLFALPLLLLGLTSGYGTAAPKSYLKPLILPESPTDEELEQKLGGFSSGGEMVGKEGNIRRASRLIVDGFLAYDLHRDSVYMGFGLSAPELEFAKVRLSLQGANDRLGLGLSYPLPIAVVDMRVGVAVFEDFETKHIGWAVYGSLFRF